VNAEQALYEAFEVKHDLTAFSTSFIPVSLFDLESRFFAPTHTGWKPARRLIAADDAGVAFRWKDCRADGQGRWKTMRLHPHEFIRRFLLHVLPKGSHRIRHYGLLASANRAESIATARALLGVAPPAVDTQKQPDITPDTPRVLPCPCPRCGARMIVIEVFARGCEPRWRPQYQISIALAA